MSNIGIFYGSSGGITENISWYIAMQLMNKGANVDIYDVATAAVSDMSAYSRIIFGSSTWKSKILLEDWEDYFLKMRGFDFSDKKIAFFGTGDQKLYPGTFVDSMGYIHQQAVEKGAKSVGCWSTDGYLFADSYGIVDGEFVGLAVDEHNQPHKTMKRVADWVDSIYSDMIH